MNTTKNPRNHFFHVVAIQPRLRGKAKYVARTISMARTISIKRKTALTIVHHPSPSRWLLRLLLGLHLISHFTPLQSKYLVDWMRRNTSATKRGTTALLHVSCICIIEGSLEVKLPTIWTDEKQSREEAKRRGRLEERRVEEKE